MSLEIKQKLTSTKIYKKFESSLIPDLLFLRKGQQDVFNRNWEDANKIKKAIIFIALFVYVFIFFSILMMITSIIDFLKSGEFAFSQFPNIIFPIIVSSYFTVRTIYGIKLSRQTAMNNFWRSSLIPILFLSFVIYSTLCFIRLCFSLPFLLSQPKKSDFLERENYDNYLDLSNAILSYFNLSFLYSHSMKVIILFMLFRLVLNLFNRIKELEENLKKAKLIWKSTVIIWGVIFTILTTISIIWVASLGK